MNFYPFEKRERGDFRRWIFGVAHNVLRHAFRAVGRRPKRQAPATDESNPHLERIPSDISSVSQRIARDDDMRHFIKVLDQLDDNERRVLVIRTFERLSHAKSPRRSKSASPRQKSAGNESGSISSGSA